jgi:hypothetical protein
MIRALALALLAFAEDGAVNAPTIANDLREALALAAPKDRRAAAIAITRRKDATLETVTLAIDEALRREAAPSGMRVLRAPIFAAGSIA